jgi:hypothetical protein
LGWRGGFADQLEVLRILQRDGLGDRQLHGRVEELAVARRAARIADEGGKHAFLGGHGGGGHAPALRRGGHQHGAGACAELAVLLVAVLDRVGATREMDAHGGIDIRGLLVAEAGADLGPVGVQLLREDHREARFHALSHVHAVAQDGGGAVLVDADEGHRLLGGLGAGLGVGLLSGGQAREQRKAHGAADGGGDEGAARDANPGDEAVQTLRIQHGGLLQAS